MNLIVAVDQCWNIGNQGQLLFHIPQDMRFFRSMTLNKTVVMGRKTFESLPGKKPLPDRTNIILSRDPAFSAPGTIHCDSYAKLQQILPSYPEDEIFLVGGSMLYHTLCDCCKLAYVTRIDTCRPADSSFPDLSVRPNWVLLEESEVYVHNDIPFRFCTYRNNNVKSLSEV